MRSCAFLLLGAALALGGGCSNDSGTSGPQVMPVELDVRVIVPPHPVPYAVVRVLNMNAITNSDGLATFHTDINTLMPNNTYPIMVAANGLVQVSPEGDTIRVPSSPNETSGYLLQAMVQMKQQ